MKKNEFNVLVVAAHPDDEVLGCGGAIARHAQSGEAVYVLILGKGILSRYKNVTTARKKEINDLRRHSKAAADILGVKKIFFLNFPDNSFDSVPILKIIKEIEKIKGLVAPRIVYTHHYADLNVDHCVTYKAVLTAFRPLKGESVREIYSFEVPSSTEWRGPDKKTAFVPDRFIDISGAIDKKAKALGCYKGELCPYPHPRSVKGAEIIAAKRGMEAGLNFAEAFETIRVILK